MAETIEELTIEWSDDDGTVTTKELDKEVLTKGAWTTVMYLYQDWNKAKSEYGSPKIRIQRYQKRDGSYFARSKFNISSEKQAKRMVEIINSWFDDEENENED